MISQCKAVQGQTAYLCNTKKSIHLVITQLAKFPIFHYLIHNKINSHESLDEAATF